MNAFRKSFVHITQKERKEEKIYGTSRKVKLTRKKRRELRRWAEKHGDQKLLDKLDAIEDRIKRACGVVSSTYVLKADVNASLQKSGAFVGDEMLRLRKICSDQNHLLIKNLKDFEDNSNAAQELLDEVNAELTDAKEAHTKSEEKAERLKQEIAWQKEAEELLSDDADDARTGAALLGMLAGVDRPNVTQCLRIISSLAPEAVTVLPSAWVSAAEVDRHFKGTERLLTLLAKLATIYRSTLIEKGNSEARKVFSTGEFSANESEATSRSRLGQLRTFLYKGDEIEASQHLRIGVASNKSVTIRVYFGWVPEEERFVIGYCGEHLPTSTHKH